MCGQQDRSELTGSAFQCLRNDLELERLRESADLYAEVYRVDPDLQALTDAAIEGWPELPMRIRFDGDRYFVDDDVVDLYGTGATLAEAQEDYWLAFQEACADLSANQDQLAPYLQDQLSFLLICQSLASG
jgi:hypothetical protein